MIYFAWASHTPTPTHTGTTNPHTGKRSQAGSLSAFTVRGDRDRFIAQTQGAAIVVTAKEARKLKAGLNDRAFKELVAVLVGGDL